MSGARPSPVRQAVRPAAGPSRLARPWDDDGRATGGKGQTVSHRLEDAFRQTAVHVWVDRTHLVAEPAERGTAEGPRPPADRVHVISAWNPGGDLAEPTANATAQRSLVTDIREAGWTHWDAEGVALDDTWAEDSIAVADVDETAVLDIARRYGQAAIFRWTADALAIVWTDARPDTVAGYVSRELSRR